MWKIPNNWRTANVRHTLVFLKVSPQKCQTIGQISLTSFFSKIFERIVKEKTTVLFHTNSGFLSKCSTCTQLLDCVNDWTLSLHNRHNVQVDVIYFGFAKAFDSVSHPKLLHKLRASGFCGDLLCSNFLQDRTQRVVLPNDAFTCRSVIFWVPQGSVLWPVLFLVYIYKWYKRQKLKVNNDVQGRLYIYHTTKTAKINMILLCNTSPECQCSAV